MDGTDYDEKNFEVTRAASRGVADYLWTDYHVPVDREE